MLYYLSLLTHTDQLAFFRLFRYLTFRSGAAVMTALAIAFVINPPLIRWLKLKQGKGQPIRSDGPQRHILEKAGTPTMGGLLILIPCIGSTLLWAQLSNRYVWIVLMVVISYGLLGFMDDYYKVTKRTADGLSGRARLAISRNAARRGLRPTRHLATPRVVAVATQLMCWGRTHERVALRLLVRLLLLGTARNFSRVRDAQTICIADARHAQ